MKIKVKDCDYKYPDIIMKTSIRGNQFSIRCHEADKPVSLYKPDIGFWPHLNVSQAKRLIEELRDFVNWEVESKARREHGI